MKPQRHQVAAYSPNNDGGHDAVGYKSPAYITIQLDTSPSVGYKFLSWIQVPQLDTSPLPTSQCSWIQVPCLHVLFKWLQKPTGFLHLNQFYIINTCFNHNNTKFNHDEGSPWNFGTVQTGHLNRVKLP